MTIPFLLLAAALVAIALAIVLPPIWRQAPVAEDDAQARHLRIARQRLAELDDQLQAGLLSTADHRGQRAELELALHADLSGHLPQPAAKPAGRWLVWLLLAAIPAFSGGWYAWLGHFQALEPTAAMLGQAPEQADGAELAAITEQLAAKMRANPGDAEGWVMLGKSYQLLQQHANAAAAFKEAHRLLGDTAEILLLYANALAMANNGQFSGQPAQLVAKALALQPDHASALLLAGIANAQAGDTEAARQQWERLAGLLPAGSEAQQEVRRLLGQLPAGQPAQTGAAVTVTVSLSARLRQQAQPGDSVFIYAQAPEGLPMPLAIVRKTVADLPLTVRLSDAQAITASNKLSDFAKVRVIARVTRSGTAAARPGDLVGRLEAVPVGGQTVHPLSIDGVVP